MVLYNKEDIIEYDPKDVLNHLKGNYSRIERIERTKSGALNLGFLIYGEGEGKKFGKLHNPLKDKAHILLEEKYSEALFNSGIPVPRIIRNNYGELHTDTPIGNLSLYEFIEGNYYSGSNQEIKGGAEMQARIHGVDLDELAANRPGEDFIDDLGELFSRVQKIVDSDIVCKDLLSEAKKYLDSWSGFRKVPEKTIIHADYHPWNLRFIDGQVCRVFDFDFVQPGRQVYDLGISLTYFHRTPDNRFDPQQARERTKLYLDSYS